MSDQPTLADLVATGTDEARAAIRDLLLEHENGSIPFAELKERAHAHIETIALLQTASKIDAGTLTQESVELMHEVRALREGAR